MALRIERYGHTRHWAVYDDHELVVVTLYKRGAREVLRRLVASRQPQPAPLPARQANGSGAAGGSGSRHRGRRFPQARGASPPWQDAAAAGQQQWRTLAREAARRGKRRGNAQRVAVLPPTAYGGDGEHFG